MFKKTSLLLHVIREDNGQKASTFCSLGKKTFFQTASMSETVFPQDFSRYTRLRELEKYWLFMCRLQLYGSI